MVLQMLVQTILLLVARGKFFSKFEIFSSVVDSIILQTFALEFARKNGLDPDSPEGLSKVSFTRLC